MDSLVIDIQRCSIHDGPGIRTTVFLKGCPLNCKWCHNPESKNFKKQLSYNAEKCTSCRACEKICKKNVHVFENNVHTVNFANCDQCGECQNVCPENALSVIGKKYSPQDILSIVRKDAIFYEQGGGGITISGGEALSHSAFCKDVLEICKENNIHTCVETSCFTTKKSIESTINFVDLFLIDFKISHSPDSKKYIGQSSTRIFENIDYIYNKGKNIIIRCPIIPTVNDTHEHFDAIIALSKKYPKILHFELLPYHNFGITKAKNAHLDFFEFPIPTAEQKQSWLAYLTSQMGEKIKIA